MTEPIVQMLEELEGGTFTPMPPQPGALKELETKLGRRMPDDIRQVFTRWGGGTVTVPGVTPLGFGPLGELVNSLDDPEYNRYLPGMIVIGDTGGGYIYFYDPENRLGRGSWYLYLVSMGDLGLGNAKPVAASATEALKRLLEGEDFMENPEIGTEGDG